MGQLRSQQCQKSQRTVREMFYYFNLLAKSIARNWSGIFSFLLDLYYVTLGKHKLGKKFFESAKREYVFTNIL